MCTLTAIIAVNVQIARAGGSAEPPPTSRTLPRCQPSTYAGGSPDAGAVVTATAPAATSPTASTSRRASDSSL